MRIFFSFFILMMQISFCFAQQNEKETLWKGTGKFILGADKSDFISDTNLLPIRNEFDSNKIIKGSYYYESVPSKSLFYSFGGVKFQKHFLYFQNDKVLNQIMFHINYSKKDTAAYLKLAEDDMVNLAFYLKRKLKQRGVKAYSQNDTDFSSILYDWKKKEFNISLQIIQYKIIGSESALISLVFSKKE